MASGENDAIIFAGGLVICKTFIIFTVHFWPSHFFYDPYRGRLGQPYLQSRVYRGQLL